MTADAPLWAESRTVSFEDCYFYHTIDLPGRGEIAGEWDLRANVDDYLGGVSMAGKRVLDLGTANGFLSFAAERRGASEVVSYDIDESASWDVVPYAGFDREGWLRERREHTRRLNNAYWYCHRALGSRARMVYGSVYDIPASIGLFEISLVGSLLLHLSHPWRCLRNVLRLTRETVVITEKLSRRHLPLRYLRFLDRPYLVFLPDARRRQPVDGWWMPTPSLIRRMIAVLGFERSELRFHSARYQGRREQLFTVTGHRTRPLTD
jgi:SAM-dependent methyltransferase